jgi:hypothetical protein
MKTDMNYGVLPKLFIVAELHVHSSIPQPRYTAIAVMCYSFALLCFAFLCFALLCFALLCFALLCFALHKSL